MFLYSAGNILITPHTVSIPTCQAFVKRFRKVCYYAFFARSLHIFCRGRKSVPGRGPRQDSSVGPRLQN